MRIIKFRAWDKARNKMLDKVLASRYDGGACSLVWVDNYWVHFDEYCGELMQYTGLKDKNGQEIYEGDIIATCKEANSIVIYSQGAFCGKEINGWDVMTSIYPLAGNISESEVIGNIYENPELLKEVKDK